MAKTKSGSLDTNILLRLIVGDVPAQTTIIEKLLESAKILYVPDIVIFETVFVLQSYYQFTREDIAESLTAVMRHPKINCNRPLFVAALSMYRQHTKLSFVDCALPEYAQLHNSTPLYTFDQALAKTCPTTTSLLTDHA